MVSRVADGTVAGPASPSKQVSGAGKLAGLRALMGVPGFVQLCASNGIAQAGQRLQNLALGWLVLEMTGSELLLGVIVGGPALAVVGASLLGGVLSDSRHAQVGLIWTRLALAFSTLFAALLVTTGQIEFGLLLLVGLVTGIATAVDMPVGRTLIFERVGPERALSGTAMSSMAVNLCAAGGPVVVGLLMSRLGVDAALYAIGACYLVSAVLVPAGRADAVAGRRENPLKELRAGVEYVRSTPCLRWLIALCFLVPVAGIYFAMVPVYAHDVLHAGPSGLGVVMAAYGAGTVAGSAYLVLNGQVRHRGCRITQFGVLFGAAVVVFGLSNSVLLCGIAGFGIGVTAMLWMNTLTALVQTVAVPEMKGRVMGLATMGMQLMSLGWLIAGALSTLAGPVFTVALAGTAFVVLSVLVYAKSPDVRAID